jgi:cation diffusion facilitator family transporter
MAVSKHIAALVSVIASITLAVTKILVGLLTGSLSILAEAIDSVLDLLAAGVTMMVVRVSDLPPDENHPYGHARAENLGALAQTVLLVATAALVLWHALERIFISPVIPTITFWSFLVVAVSLVINIGRIFLLSRATAHDRSDTLSANIANFVNDTFGSLVVLLALLTIALQPWLSLPSWLVARADAIGAVLVACLALGVAWRMGRKAIRALMDDVPPDLSRSLVERVSTVPHVVPESIQVRTRFVGDQPFVDVTVGTPRGRSLEEAHQLANDVKQAIRDELNEASVLVHVEPTRTPAETYTTAVYSVAQYLGLRVHNLDVYQLADEILVKVDLELPGNQSLREAHATSERLEAAIAADLPCHARVTVHLEPRRDNIQPAVRYEPLNERVVQVLDALPYTQSILRTETLLTDKGMVVTLQAQFPGVTSLTEVHEAMADIEHDLQRAMPDIVSVQIDPEISECLPPPTDGSSPQHFGTPGSCADEPAAPHQ